jgi:WD40 repeat protein
MLRPPSEYESTRVELSNRVAKVENLYFDSAIIFFTPKVANKGVDLASLQCTIVQITDRGEWGKEEETFTVDASSISNRKYRTFDLNTDAEYSLKILPPPELRMGILEIYFDPNQSFSPMATINNPSSDSIDLSAVTAAIAAGSAAQVAAIQQAQAENNRVVGKVIDEDYTAIAWSNDAQNHIAVQPDTGNLRLTFLNKGTKDVYWDTFIDIGSKLSTPQYDNVMKPKGSITIEGNEASVGVLLYTLTGTQTSDIAVTIER